MLNNLQKVLTSTAVCNFSYSDVYQISDNIGFEICQIFNKISSVLPIILNSLHYCVTVEISPEIIFIKDRSIIKLLSKSLATFKKCIFICLLIFWLPTKTCVLNSFQILYFCFFPKIDFGFLPNCWLHSKISQCFPSIFFGFLLAFLLLFLFGLKVFKTCV